MSIPFLYFNLSAAANKGIAPVNRSVLSVVAILLALTGCGPAPKSSSNDIRRPAVPAADREPLQLVQVTGEPQVSTEKIGSDIIGRVVRVSEVHGAGPNTEWTFEAGEFRQVDVLESHLTEKGLTLVIFMTTRNNPGPSEDSVQVSGKLRLQYELKAGSWALTTVENLTFSYSIGVSA